MSQVRVTSLGSGSKGNATLVAYEHTKILIDNGFSCKVLESRLLERNINPNQIDAILVTHEHSDHINGVPVFSNRYDIPVWMSHGTSLHHVAEKIINLNVFNSHHHFFINDIKISPVLVPHDAREACQFILSYQETKIGLLTDLGHITSCVSEQFKDCNILLLEFNHDKNMLMTGRYPASLKSRVGGSLGHLNNEQAIAFVESLDSSMLDYLVVMHISGENNSVDLVESLISKSQLKQTKVIIADQDKGFSWIET